MTDATPLLLAQVSDDDGRPRLARVEDDSLIPYAEPLSTLDVAHRAIAGLGSLAAVIASLPWGAAIPLAAAEGRWLPPVTHPDPRRLHVTGTGLTHLGSAEARDRMHAAVAVGAETDTIRMFRMGIDGGRPSDSGPGVQPEWFWKGDGRWLVASGAPLVSPGWAEDAGEEPELVAVYLNGPDGTPHRLGFAVANEFSDHVMERRNYLWLSHSKLRPCAVGPCLRVGPLPEDLRGASRILREGEIIWERPFVTGEHNMSHSLANLEHHHFKYAPFREPDEVHLHLLGTATLSHADGMICQDGDIFEAALPGFGPPLRNMLQQETAAPPMVRVELL